MKLDLFSGREPHIVDLSVAGEKKAFKIPADFTEEDIERILEIEDKMSGSDDVRAKRNYIFTQVYLLFRRYQPEITLQQVKAMLTWDDALKIIQFVSANSFGKSKDGEAADTDPKAPVKS